MNPNTSIPEMLQKLDEMFEQEEKLKKAYRKLQHDKKLLMSMIQYKQGVNSDK